jgi:hypothetical protein
MSLFCGLYISERPAHLHTLPVSDLQEPASTNIEADQQDQDSAPSTLPPLMALTENPGSWNIGPTFRGFIAFMDDCDENCQRVRIVAKCALNGEAKVALAHEASVYASLRKAGVNGIPRLIGLFDDLDDDSHILVTTDRCGPRQA